MPAVLSDNYTYEISVYDINDTEYTQAIAENVGMQYLFEKPGKYALKYTLVNLETQEITYEYSVVTVIDCKSPVLFLNGAYADYYEAGESVSLLDVSIYDDADTDLTEYSYQVFLNGKEVTSNVSNGVLTVEGGSYEIVYSAMDKSGNIGTLNVYFNGAGDTTSDNINTVDGNSCSATIGAMPFLGVGLAGMLCALKRRRAK